MINDIKASAARRTGGKVTGGSLSTQQARQAFSAAQQENPDDCMEKDDNVTVEHVAPTPGSPGGPASGSSLTRKPTHSFTTSVSLKMTRKPSSLKDDTTMIGGNLVQTAAGLWEANTAARKEQRGETSAIGMRLHVTSDDAFNLVFPEFVEAVGAASAIKWQNEPSTLLDKMRRGFAAVVAADTHKLLKRKQTSRSITASFTNQLQRNTEQNKTIAVSAADVERAIEEGLDHGVMSQAGSTFAGLGVVQTPKPSTSGMASAARMAKRRAAARRQKAAYAKSLAGSASGTLHKSSTARSLKLRTHSVGRSSSSTTLQSIRSDYDQVQQSRTRLKRRELERRQRQEASQRPSTAPAKSSSKTALRRQTTVGRMLRSQGSAGQGASLAAHASFRRANSVAQLPHEAVHKTSP